MMFLFKALLCARANCGVTSGEAEISARTLNAESSR